MRVLGAIALAAALAAPTAALAAPPWSPPRTVGEGATLDGAAVLLTERGRAVMCASVRRDARRV